MATKLNEGTEVALPLRNIVSMLAFTALATWAYFGVVERLNQIETSQTMMKTDLEQNTEFRIKWPLGQLGALPDDAEQNMRLGFIEKDMVKLETHVDSLRIKNVQQELKEN